jgi:RimJ/RimL family protein N-acetyltransferase
VTGPVRLSGDLVSLRELRDDDQGPLHAVYGNEQVCRYMSFTPRTPEQCAAIIASAKTAAATDPRKVYMLAVADPVTGELIGACRLGIEDWQAAQAGLALRPDQWGQGCGTEVLRLLFRLAFTQLGLHRVWAARSPGNEASRRLLLAAGMREDGTIRSHVLRHGVWKDSATASIIEDEYRSSS